MPYDRSATLEANKRIGRGVLLEIWGEGKLEVADELYAPEFVDHAPSGPEPQIACGPEGIKEAVSLPSEQPFRICDTRSRRRWLNAIS